MMDEKKMDERFMREAIRQARKAGALMEVPIGCVIVYEGKIIARGYNRRNTDKNTISHAELNAIRKASKKLGDWRLEGCTMYITLEPCQMCAGAIVQARVSRVVIGSMNESGMRRIDPEPSGDGTVQSSGRSYPWRFTGRVLPDAQWILQRTA